MKLDFEYGSGMMSAQLPDSTKVFIPGETVADPPCIPEERLVEDGILDSFDIVSIVAELDGALGVRIGAEELVPENFNSARALWALVRRHRG